MARRPRAPHVALTLTPGSEPLPRRIAAAIVDAVRDGRLRDGDPLPSTRALAERLGVSRGPVVAAFDELSAAGFVTSRAGSGSVVMVGADEAARAGARSHVDASPVHGIPPRVAQPAPARWDLRPGRPDTTLIDPLAWRRAWRRAAVHPIGDDAGDAPSHTELRAALADHLRRTRGVALDPGLIIVTPGVGASLRALPAGLGLSGRAVALEDPGYVEAATALRAEGVRLLPIAVDDDGLDPARLGRRPAAVYVTPSHQYPLGARMPVTRRVALLEWARRHERLVIEDDYDGEFRYDVAPLPALRSLPGAADHVVYVGTASKLLAPSLRIGWIAPPARWHAALSRELTVRGLVVGEVPGRALAELMTGGALTAHHARAARVYAARRAALVAALGARLPGARLGGVEAGLHLVLRLAPGSDDHEVADRMEQRGLRVSPLSAYCMEADHTGLVLCYAGLPESEADAVARALSTVPQVWGT